MLDTLELLPDLSIYIGIQEHVVGRSLLFIERYQPGGIDQLCSQEIDQVAAEGKTVADHVLSNFTKDERIALEKLYPEIREELIALLT